MKFLGRLVLAVLLVGFGMGVGYSTGYGTGRTNGIVEGKIMAYYDQASDATMYYLNCLNEPPHCEANRLASQYFNAKADKHIADQGVTQ